MWNSKPNPSPSTDHEHYVELCALATSGTLSEMEWQELKAHLAHCRGCSKLVQEYRVTARSGMAILMPEWEAGDGVDAQPTWSPEIAKRELLGRIAQGESAPQSHPRSRVEPQAARGRWWSWLLHPQPRMLPQYSVALFLAVAMALVGYRAGVMKAQKLLATEARPSSQQVSPLQTELQQLTQERSAIAQRLQAQTDVLRSASQELQRRMAEVEKWKALQNATASELLGQRSSLEGVQSQYASALVQLDSVNHRLQESEARLQTVQQKYDALREQHSAELLRTASLETRIGDLSVQLRESESAAQQQQQFLASDRDIRALMGARQLYIADVFDVGPNGRTQQAFGRVFYTKNTSLIFYAFDLDQQPRLREASIFQAWGRRGLNDKRPLNMGVFYLDNETNKRWVLRFDDPQALSQIDAVFVTVEPHGGSEKPSGKQLLFASLRRAPNHP